MLVGDGPAMPELKLLVEKYHLDNHILLLGFRNNVHNLLCISNLALHASLGEGFSLSIIEYMSAGLPVLVPNIPSVSQAIRHNVNGLIYPKDDCEMVAKSIMALATDEKLRAALSIAAQTCANNQYSLDKCTNDFIIAIDEIYKLTH